MGWNLFCLYLIFRTATPSVKHVLNTGIPGTCQWFVVTASLCQYFFYVSPEIPWVLESKGAHLVHLGLPCAGSSKTRFCFFQRNNNFPCQLSFESYVQTTKAATYALEPDMRTRWENLFLQWQVRMNHVNHLNHLKHLKHFHFHFECCIPTAWPHSASQTSMQPGHLWEPRP